MDKKYLLLLYLSGLSLGISAGLWLRPHIAYWAVGAWVLQITSLILLILSLRFGFDLFRE